MQFFHDFSSLVNFCNLSLALFGILKYYFPVPLKGLVLGQSARLSEYAMLIKSAVSLKGRHHAGQIKREITRKNRPKKDFFRCCGIQIFPENTR